VSVCVCARQVGASSALSLWSVSGAVSSWFAPYIVLPSSYSPPVSFAAPTNAPPIQHADTRLSLLLAPFQTTPHAQSKHQSVQRTKTLAERDRWPASSCLYARRPPHADRRLRSCTPCYRYYYYYSAPPLHCTVDHLVLQPIYTALKIALFNDWSATRVLHTSQPRDTSSTPPPITPRDKAQGRPRPRRLTNPKPPSHYCSKLLYNARQRYSACNDLCLYKPKHCVEPLLPGIFFPVTTALLTHIAPRTLAAGGVFWKLWKAFRARPYQASAARNYCLRASLALPCSAVTLDGAS
jgi:hypothetical protein